MKSVKLAIIGFGSVGSAVALCLTTGLAQTGGKPIGTSDLFDSKVKAILTENCISCHSGDKPAAGLSLTTRANLLKGGAHGPAIHLAKGSYSHLLTAINYGGPKMPPSGKLPQSEIDTLTAWVNSGAAWPEKTVLAPSATKTMSPPVNAETMKFWSFQPVRKIAVPSVKNTAWVSNPIDRFILSKLESNGLQPAPAAGKAALLRRLTYDLIGLPPTPDQVKAFVADTSPNAYEKVVDRLLASPQYGEKWGRHWLDLVHFAETNSYERDGNKPNAWRYRDYVIKSFNNDKPYNQFVTEQLAGDEMPNRTPEQLIATGYYRLGLWDDEPADPEQALYDDLDDISSTTSTVMLGLTIGCARCHDHKIDPIPQKDYYKFLAFFSGVRRFGERSFESIAECSLRPISSPDVQAKHAVEIAAHTEKVNAVQTKMRAIERKVFAEFSPVDKEEFRAENRKAAILAKHIGPNLTEADLKDYRGLVSERRRLTEFQPGPMEMALCVTETPEPRLMHIMMRGNPHVEGDLVNPGFPSVLNPPTPTIEAAGTPGSSGRRTALAKWVTSNENPLTARVMVNRIWQYHFGRGIVRTSSNFGFQGSKPTHPELLDWLAGEFVNGGWKMKPLHKMILMSSAYRMSSTAEKTALAKDPENDLFWRFDMRRLQAEELRDSILAVNGSLNPKMFGPSIYTTIPKEVLAGQSMPGAGWGHSTPEEEARRSVYIYVKRSLITPIIAAFDGPETDFTCPVRFATTQPTQALSTLNSTFINESARMFRDNLAKNAGPDMEKQVKLALWRVMQREPNAKEIDRGIRMINSTKERYHVSSDEAMLRFCVVALNLNEFIYLD
ncbi:MAG: PSD1 and planctomycete cytochrome C domain-containing protein [Chthonomonadales bacterium]